MRGENGLGPILKDPVQDQMTETMVRTLWPSRYRLLLEGMPAGCHEDDVLECSWAGESAKRVSSSAYVEVL